MQQLERVAQTGDVTFLFSDIEGSTARWKMYPDAMPVYLHRHDALLHAAISENGGDVFKTVGDEFCAAFESPRDAVHAAIAAQRALAQQDWSAVGGLRVRMAVHCGAVSQRDGDYFGSTVNRVARLLSAGHGGQVLISADAAGALEEGIAGIELRDLGRHRLKDFPELESIYQLVAPALPDVFPPLRTIAERPSNLPSHPTPLIGREGDLDRLRHELVTHQILTLVGAGGVGKTALALQAGLSIIDGYEDGVWIAELAPVDAGAVASTLAAVFGVTSLAAGDSILEALISYLKNKKLLLIIDNCEHVLAAAAQAVQAIAHECAGVHILATSRERLGLSNETLYRLAVLDIDAACDLFAERARTHVPGFALTSENAADVTRICRRLDGIALAIELAAPRLRVLSLPQLADRLTERFRLLTGGNRHVLPHHQTLRALIDWSYELLTEQERTLLRRAALFPGGWTLGAVVDVCADEWLEEWDILDHMGSLVDKSLVISDADGAEPRYRMLESTREYALERLEQSGERSVVARKQAEYLLHLAQRADDAWPNVPATTWIAPLNAELDNFRAALSWCISQHNDNALGIRLFDSLEAFWWDAQPVEGRRWIDELSGVPQANEDSRDAARYWLTTAGVALTLAREKRALVAAEKSLKIFEEIRDANGVAAAKRALGSALIMLGRLDEGEAAVREALDVFRAAGNQRLTALALRTLAAAPMLRGDMDTAGALYREALGLSQALQDERGIQNISGTLAELEAYSGNYTDALSHNMEALQIARERRDWIVVASFLINSAAYLVALERFDEARSMAREGLEAAAEIQSDFHLAVVIQHLGAVAAFCGDPARAARLIGFADEAYKRLEATRELIEANEYERVQATLGERLPADELAAHLRAGALLTNEQVKCEALLT
jgi:predicted ATPase/class 3 adenylate cyclase